eukprot:TRINITY_DN2796_c0_g1_i4.p1 TRINITY_DN2796_c0_g1~~TRINITY_DN2796_c0_g1_i4.p1  ORF type:complete len:746 (+),score=210.22 TRINITY_DN2796_c0_g1_i4:70-2307(+)
MRLPTAVVGVTTMAALVAVSSVLVFVITKNNAEDSINIVSRRFSGAKMETVINEIRFKLQREPEDAIVAAKSDIEMGLIRFDSPIEQWVRRASHFFRHSGFFTLYMALSGNRALGETYGFGTLVDAAAKAVIFNNPPVVDVKLSYVPENGTWDNSTTISSKVNLSGRAYVSMYHTGPNYVQYLTDNVPRWTTIIVSVNPNLKGGGGPFVTLTVPVFRTPVPNPADFIGVTCTSIYLSFFSLHPYLLSQNSHLVLIDENKMLVSSTDVDMTYYANGTLPTGKPNYLRHTLLSTNVTIYHSLDAALPDLSLFTGNEEHFAKLSHGGTYWIEIRPVYHSNLRWYLIGLVPEKEFFQKIYDSNRDTSIIVIILVVTSTIIATIVTLAFTMNLTRLAKAFDKVANMQLEHCDVMAVGKSHFLYELDSLYHGFWHAVEMVKQVQAFLPDAARDETDDSETSEGHTQGQGSKNTGPRSDGSFSNDVVTTKQSMFALGLKSSRLATSMTINLTDFTVACKQGIDDAVTKHKQLFLRAADLAKTFNGVISYLEGNRIVVTWNTVRSCPSTTSRQCSTTLGLELHAAAKDITRVDIGIHTAYSFHGILGSAQQRFNVIGSDLVDVGSHMALHGKELGLVPSVFASDAVVDGLNGVVEHRVDRVRSLTTNEEVRVHWIREKVQAAEEEWMYQLEAQNAQKDLFLNSYWAAMDACNHETALECLEKFKSENPNLVKLSDKLHNDTVVRNGIPVMDVN